jgi:hypothetical protein
MGEGTVPAAERERFSHMFTHTGSKCPPCGANVFCAVHKGLPFPSSVQELICHASAVTVKNSTTFYPIDPFFSLTVPALVLQTLLSTLSSIQANKQMHS